MKLDEAQKSNLVKEAIKAREKAYAPYSKFKVGASILTDKGSIFHGCNVENASYGAAICAERTACVSMVAAGERKPIAIAVCYNETDYASPCGICRQFLAEFNPQMTVLMARLDGAYEETTLEKLLPSSFSLSK